MIFTHHPDIRERFPTLRAMVLQVARVNDVSDTSAAQAALLDQARANLRAGTESELPPIKMWRQTYAAMGYKPTQYRCASESLLRRLRKSDDLPAIGPFVDLCNALSVAYAVPVAAFDLAKVTGSLTVRMADGSETYHSFGGDTESPEPGELIFSDDAGLAHARRWAHRQSAHSAISSGTESALVVAEAFHENAEDDLEQLADRMVDALSGTGGSAVRRALLRPGDTAFEAADA